MNAISTQKLALTLSIPFLRLRQVHLGRAAVVALAFFLLRGGPMLAAPADTVEFIPVGFLAGDTSSGVYAVNSAVTVAGCYSYHLDPNPPNLKIFSYAARWTSSDGLQPLPRLPNTADAASSGYFASGNDVTPAGTRIAFTGPTDDLTGRAAGISDPDGSNLIALTSLPNGDKMQFINQLSDDGMTAFGYHIVDLYAQGAIWTASGGIEALVPLAGYTYIAPRGRAISGDGTVSAGDLFNINQYQVETNSQAYRWTSSGGVVGIGYLPGGSNSTTSAMSSDGTTILGLSNTTSDDTIYPDTHFLWSTTDGMMDIGNPQYETARDLFGGRDGLSASGDVAVVSSGAYSFVRRADYPYYFLFEDVLAQAGGIPAGWSYFELNGITDDGNTLYGQANGPNGWEGFIAKFPADFLRGLTAPVPNITSELNVGANVGAYFFYIITANGYPDSFDAQSLPPGLEVSTATNGYNLRVGFISGIPTIPGVYSVPISATNVGGTGTATLTITVTYPTPAPRLLNISTRLQVLLGDNVLIGGFIIPGGEPKKVILRALGPSLTDQGVGGVLGDPVLELHKPDGSVITNDDWKDSQQTEIEDTGIPPTDDHEAAMVATLDPGAYTAIVSGKNATTGIALVEAYDLANPPESELANISTRGFVDTGDNVLIGGIIIGGDMSKVIVRAIGPSLADSNVSNPLMDPTLEIHGEDGSTLFSNDDWKEAQEMEIEETGIPPTDERESAIVATLPIGNYTAIVRGKDNTTGVALVEFYHIF